MKYVVSFFVILLTIFYINIARSESLIVYINMEMIMNKTNAGKSISQKLEKIHNANIAEFKKIEEKLKEEEASILSQKNILSEVDYSKKINLMNNKIDQYKKNMDLFPSKDPCFGYWTTWKLTSPKFRR